jgi:hypothetical protein
VKQVQLHTARKNSERCHITFKDLYLTPDAGARFRQQSIHTVISVLFRSAAFEKHKFKGHATLKRPAPLHPILMGPDRRTKQWMLGTMPIEEATYGGNAQVVSEVLRQVGLGATKSEAWLVLNGCIPWGGDQMTFSRLSMLQHFKHANSNGFLHWDWMIPFIGWFHVKMCLANVIYKNHRGDSKGFSFGCTISLVSIKGMSSATEKPYFHHIDDLLDVKYNTQVRMLWLWATGLNTLKEVAARFAADNNTAALVKAATKIVTQWMSMLALANLETSGSQDANPTLFNQVLLARDLDLYQQLRSAIKQGDTSWMEDLMKLMVYMFKGGGNGNYCKLMIKYINWYQYEVPETVR